MKFTKEQWFSWKTKFRHDDDCYHKDNNWIIAAKDLTIKYGILVEVIIIFDEATYGCKEIAFKVGDHKFDCTNDVIKAFENKAFL